MLCLTVWSLHMLLCSRYVVCDACIISVQVVVYGEKTNLTCIYVSSVYVYDNVDCDATPVLLGKCWYLQFS